MSLKWPQMIIVGTTSTIIGMQKYNRDIKKSFTLKTFIYCTREKKTLETKMIASVNACSW